MDVVPFHFIQCCTCLFRVLALFIFFPPLQIYLVKSWIKNKTEPGMFVILNTQEAEAGGLRVGGQPELHRQSQENKTKMKRTLNTLYISFHVCMFLLPIYLMLKTVCPANKVYSSKSKWSLRTWIFKNVNEYLEL